MSTPRVRVRTIHVVRYVTPLREGGSLPAISEADDGGLYVVKFRGAGQGPKALIAELIGGEVAMAAGLHVPEIVFANLNEAYGRTEPDPEIQDLLKFSEGLNIGIRFLKGAAAYDPASFAIDDFLASKIVWLDCFLLNVDRTIKNTNLLVWKNELWLIDHGASLYFHHSWQRADEKASMPFSRVRDHVLLPYASKLQEADQWFHQRLTSGYLKNIVDLIPENWLMIDTPFSNPDENKKAYLEFLLSRFENSVIFVKHAMDERAAVI